MPNSRLSVNTRAYAIVAAIFAIFIAATSSLWSQQSSTAALAAYTNGVQLSDPVKRLAVMEQFLRNEPSSSLRQDALECATWDSIRLADATRSARWGTQLLKKSPTTPLAQAALAIAKPPTNAAAIETLRNALANLDRIR